MKIKLALVMVLSALAMCQGREVYAQTAEESSHGPKMTEEAFRKAMAIEGGIEARYFGESGNEIAFPEFITIVGTGKSFKKILIEDQSLVQLTIKPDSNEESAAVEATGDSGRPRLPVGSILPPISNKDLNGHVNVLSNGKSHTLLSFFFAACLPCIQEIPALNSLDDGRDDLKVVSVTFDSKEVASKFSAEQGLKTAIVPDSQDYIDSLGVEAYPTLILVSPNGCLMGARTSFHATSDQVSRLHELEEWIDSLLKADGEVCPADPSRSATAPGS